jgi:hypothetical protein
MESFLRKVLEDVFHQKEDQIREVGQGINTGKKKGINPGL